MFSKNNRMAHVPKRREDMSSYSIGQMNQLANALEAKGFTSDHVRRLGQSRNLPLILDVLDYRAEIKKVSYSVDLDAYPYVPKGLTLGEWHGGGQFKYDYTKVKLYLSEIQKCGNETEDGFHLYKDLRHVTALNSNLLDFYLKNKHLIPEEWKGVEVFFWGTRYWYSLEAGSQCVRCLYWDGEYWNWRSEPLKNGWRKRWPMAVLVD